MNFNLEKLYNILIKKFGNQNWWPIDQEYHIKNNSDPRFEIIVGALLTQNTSWLNVEKSLLELKKANILDLKNILNIKIEDLESKIKSSGFFKQKAKRLKNLFLYLQEKYNGDFDIFFDRDLYIIRDELLSLEGIGSETADSILLYAGNKPSFVVDSYTKRICNRIPLITIISYDEIKKYFENNLKRIYQKDDLVKVYKEYHALIVLLCKKYCKKNPECDRCVINEYCNYKQILF
jgi:endonuclease-3 related protein